MEKIKQIRCKICGKFISYKDISTQEILHRFIPDSYCTTETSTYKHRKCNRKQIKKWKKQYYE